MQTRLAILGNLDFRSGGFLYDRQLKKELERRGHTIQVQSLPWDPYPVQLWRGLLAPPAIDADSPEIDLVIEDELCHPSLLRGWASQGSIRRRQRVCLVHHLRSNEDHPRWLMPLYHRVERAYLAGVGSFIYNSATTRRSVEALLGAPTRGVVAWPGKDHFPEPPPPPPSQERQQPLRLLSVGSLSQRKAPDVLLQALRGLPQGSVRVDWVGSHDAEPAFARKMRELAAGLASHNSVRFHGELEQEALHDLYRQADLFVLPSRYEGFGVVYVEAMAHGLPILAGRAGGAGEFVQDGIQGYLVDAGSAEELRLRIEGYLGNQEMLDRQGQAARARFASLPTWAETADLIDDFLRGLVAGDR